MVISKIAYFFPDLQPGGPLVDETLCITLLALGLLRIGMIHPDEHRMPNRINGLDKFTIGSCVSDNTQISRLFSFLAGG